MREIIKNKVLRSKALLILLIILSVAAFFRLWQLDSIPPGLYPDVAMNGNDALFTLETWNFEVFYPENNGREGLMMWLIAFSFLIFGASVWSIKIVAAIVGILTVLGLYLLTKELLKIGNWKLEIGNLKNEAVPLLASFFLAVSFWHTNFSRIGFRAILLPFVSVFSFYFLLKGLKTQTLRNFMLAGVFFGLGFYTYTPFRMTVLILPFILIPFWLTYRRQNLQKKFLLYISCFLFITFLIALPIGIYFLQQPQDFINRATPVSVFATQEPIKELGKSLILHLGMFNIYGDSNWRHNLAGSPQIYWPLGIIFLVGIILSFREILRRLNYRQKNYQLLFVFYFLLSSFFVMLLPGILTYEGIPHALRTIGAIPFVFVFSGIGAWKIYELLKKNIENKKLLIVTCFFFLLTVMVSEYDKYFNLWAKNKKLEEFFTENYANIGYFLNSLPEEIKKYVLVNTPGTPLYGISIAAQTPMFIESAEFGQPRATYLKFDELNQIDIYQRRSIVVPLYEDSVFDKLTEKFPWGETKMENGLKYFDLSY